MSPLFDLHSAAHDARVLGEINRWLLRQTAEERVDWGLRQLPEKHALTSSFGAQSAVSLHLLTRQNPGIPVILIDTGYLFAQTYLFVDELTERLDLNLRVYRPQLSPGWLEARHGRLWEKDLDGLQRYNRIVKIEPMQRALAELRISSWFAGLRRCQSRSREDVDVLRLQNGRWKMHAIVDWSDRQVGAYLRMHDLPYHPLWHAGYASIGDVHTTRRQEPGMREEETRFFGLKRECGLHIEA